MLDRQLGYEPKKQPVRGVDSLLRWLAMPRAGVVLCKDGSLLAGFYAFSSDVASDSSLIRDRICARIAYSLAQLGGHWSVHVDCTRVPAASYPASDTWPDPVSQWLDDERRQSFDAFGTSYESLHTWVIRWNPSVAQERATRWLFRRETDISHRLDERLDQFELTLREFVDSLDGVLTLERMLVRSSVTGEVDDFLTQLRWTLTGERIALAPLAIPMHVDAQLCLGELLAGTSPRLGDQLIGVVSLDTFPPASQADLLHHLSTLPFEYRWSTRFIGLDTHVAKKEINRIRTQWAQQTRGFMDQLANRQPKASSRIDSDAAAMVGLSDEALAELQAGLSFGYMTISFVVRDSNRDQLYEKCRLIQRALRLSGCTGRHETFNTLDAWLGSLPGHTQENVRQPLVDTMNVAHFLPLSTPWTGSSTCPSPMIEQGQGAPLVTCHTDGTTPFRLNLHVGDVGHSLVFGTTGSGKSTLLALLCAQWRRYEEAQVIAIDKDRSLETLTHAVGGTHHTLSLEMPDMSFAPLQHIDEASELEWAASWIEEICIVQQVPVSASQRQLIHEGLEQLAAQDRDRSLSALQVNIQDEPIKQALNAYTSHGAYGVIFDGDDPKPTSHWICIELAEVLAGSDQLLLPAMSYLFHLVERQANGQPTLLVMDEAWLALSHSHFREQLRLWLKTFRKLNVAVVLATQSLSDVADSGMLNVIAESCPTRIFGANLEASGVSAEVYRQLGLSEDDCEVVSQLREKREYYIVQPPSARRVVNFDLGPLALSFCGVSSKEDLKRVQQLRTDYPDDWQHAWLVERGVIEEVAA